MHCLRLSLETGKINDLLIRHVTLQGFKEFIILLIFLLKNIKYL